MKTCWIIALLCSSIPALALSGGMEKAVVHAMRKTPCAESPNNGHRNAVLSELAGSAAGGGECIEYELRTQKVSYVIRPHVAILLLLGADVYIELAKDELLLHTSVVPKDIHCSVLAMSLRAKQEQRERRQPPLCLSESGTEIACSDEPEPFR
jgi:hypothetical protein